MTAEQVADRLILSSIYHNIQYLSERSLKRLCDAACIDFSVTPEPIWCDSYDGYVWRILERVPTCDRRVVKGQATTDLVAQTEMRAKLYEILAEQVENELIEAQDLMNALMFVRAA